MEKRKRERGGRVERERLGATKKVFKTRPLTKKKAQAQAKGKAKAELCGGKEEGEEVVVVDRSGVQWRSQAEQAEWLTSTFHSTLNEECERLQSHDAIQRPLQPCSVVNFSESRSAATKGVKIME